MRRVGVVEGVLRRLLLRGERGGGVMLTGRWIVLELAGVEEGAAEEVGEAGGGVE